MGFNVDSVSRALPRPATTACGRLSLDRPDGWSRNGYPQGIIISTALKPQHTDTFNNKIPVTVDSAKFELEGDD
jgi:hypothetical protein